jgi:hypothetical protein
MRVDFGTCREAGQHTDFDDGEAGYRVEMFAPAGFITGAGRKIKHSQWLTIPTKFARKRDAELARLALIEAGIDNPEALNKARWEEMRSVMASALQW